MLRHEVAWEPQDIRRLMEGTSHPLVIHKRRQSGGTTELLRFAEKKHRTQFIFVSPNEMMSESARRIWRKENGFGITCNETLAEPTFITANTLHKINGSIEQSNIYVDEWNTLTDYQQRDLWERDFKLAVTS